MTKLNKRIMAALLVIVLLLADFPVVSFASDNFAITFEGKVVKKVEFYNHEKITVTAENIPEGSHQWQIRIPGTEQWVNIHGQTNAELGLSYAVVGSLLDEGRAYVRCAAISDGVEVAHTDALRATVKEEEPVQQDPVYETPVIEETEAPVVEETEAPVIEETEAPVVEETEAPVVEETEAPEVEETEAPVVEETEAPVVEETEAPVVEETEAPVVEETEAPVVEETEAPAVEETEAPVVEETEAPEVEETEAPVVEETEAPTEAPKETTKKTSKKTTKKTTAKTVTEQKTDPITPKAEERAAEFVTVKIQYMRYDYIKNADGNLVLSDSGQAFNPYVATLLAGSEFKTTVTFPTLVGYDTYVGDSEESTKTYAFTETSIQEDITIVVKYKPAQVDYKVRYYFQNIYDDNYIEDPTIGAAVSAEGPTGYMPDEQYVKATFPGFTSLYYEPETIAADGSTVFEVYYERNYYLMEFDCAGGYGTDTVYVRYGTYISVPQPIRSGYIFAGWDLVRSQDAEKPVDSGDGVADILPETMPCYNSAYEALWTTKQTTFTVIYWAENADDGYYSYWGTASGDAMSASEIVPLEVAQKDEFSAASKGLDDAAHFTLNEAKTAASNPATVTIAGDGSTAINVYYSRNRYTIDFVYTGECLLEEHTHTDDCYALVCGITHIHDETCTKELQCTKTVHTQHTAECLICTIPEHAAHTDACLQCSKETHTHSEDCCTLTEHTSHTAECCDDSSFPHVLGHLYGWSENYCNTNNCSGIHEHDVGECVCSTEEHEHTDSCYKDTVHAHTTECYNDTLHVHSDACYLYSCSYVSHEHDESCYGLTCIIAEHQHTANCEKTNRTNSIYKIYAKYDADISQVWETDPIKSYLDQGYVWQSSVTEKYYSFLEKMPTQDITMTATQWSGSTYTWYYCLEPNPYETWNGDTYTDGDGKLWNVYHTTTVKGSGLSLTYEEDYFPISGYEQASDDVPSFSSSGSNTYVAYLEYNLKTDLKLIYYNRSEEGPTPAAVTMTYKQPLRDFEISKEVMENSYYPAGLEPGAYEFDGWYTAPGCYPGSEVNWQGDVMPDGNVEIYAKWVPVTHNVYFHSLYTEIGTDTYWHPKDENGTEIHINYPIVVEHGELLGTTYSYIPERTDYTFIGWFYMDADNKKRFAPDSMEIKQDLHLFAEWQSGIDTEYNVTYVLDSDVTIGETTYLKGTEVADPTAGHSTAGKTKTFTAKGMAEMYQAFQSNIFPTTSSHSILMEEDKTQNSYQFTYVYDEEVYYKIRYVDYVTGAELLTSQTKVSRNSIVTEKFMPIAGYVPQSFYIRKALVSDGDSTSVDSENVITFYYTEDTEHGVYSIEYYQENLEDTDYTKYESIVGSADLKTEDGETNIVNKGDEFKIRTYEGFTYYGYKVITYAEDGTANEPTEITQGDDPSGEVSYTGLTIRLYYKRNVYPYIIEYREYGSEENVLQTVSDSTDTYKKKFGENATHTAPEELTQDSNKYEYYIADSTSDDRTKTITIRAFSGTDNPNKLIFYYLLKEVDVLYHVVYQNTSLTDLCYVSKGSESAASVNGLLGSSAMPGEGFRFVGWFSDEECTTAVDSSWITEVNGYQHLTPQQLNNELDEVNYYALFEPIGLTVTYNANGGVEVPNDTKYIGDTVTLPTTTREGYTLLGWVYDADGDNVVDDDETEYAVGSAFTMPGRNVHFIAQWVDSRIDDSHNVLVGINMSFYQNGNSLYYSFPAGEPTIVELAAARAYIATESESGNTWAIRTEGTWNRPLPGKFEDYIDPTILTAGDLVIHDDAIGVYDETGTKTKKYLRLKESDYVGIVTAWLNAKDYLKNSFSANIDWDALPKDPKKYEVIPYVVKQHWHGVAGQTDWFIDVIIVPKDKYSITYELNLKDGYVDTAPQDDNEYGQGFIANVAQFHDVTRTDNPAYIAKFLGWHYDANGNGVVDDGEIYAGGSKITIPASDITLTALWSYRMNLTIQTTGPAEDQHYIFNVSGTGDDGTAVNLTVALGANDEKTVLDLPEGTYTVTEQSDWRWKYGTPTETRTPATGKTTHWKFDYTSKEVDWLGGEGYILNKFNAVS